MGVALVAQGSITATIIDVRTLFQSILKANATDLLLLGTTTNNTIKG